MRIETDEFILRLARTPREIAEAQKLRYRVFYVQRGLTLPHCDHEEARDTDRYDMISDHLIVISKPNGFANESEIVGTYRMLKGSVANEHYGFVGEAEFDLSPLNQYSGEVAELGRACIDPVFRSKAVMQLLWRGIAEYSRNNGIGLLFGTPSFMGTDPDAIALPLSYLHHYHRGREGWMPRALSSRFVNMNRIAADRLDVCRAFLELPPLIKGYLRLGATIGDGAVIDPKLWTVDICLVLEISKVTGRYRQHFQSSLPDIDQRRERAA